MRFSPKEERFLRPGCDRLVALAGLLAAHAVPYSVVKTGNDRHLMVRIGESPLRLALAAHYDRFESSPGVLDNSCACLQLVRLAAELVRAESRPPILIVFTDAEEAPSTGALSSQGSFRLARALRAAFDARRQSAADAQTPPPTLVLDVTGRGDRLMYSTAAEALLERSGVIASHAEKGRRSLVDAVIGAAARAGIPPPLPASLPWSDDLGLTLGGIPALTLSLLPEAEAAVLARGGRPQTWDFLHTPKDGPELAEADAFKLMAVFLRALTTA
jgi:hypothetical protein